jgi:hypothetical protein
MANPIKTIAEVLGLYPQTEDVPQKPYYMLDTVVLVGTPFTPLSGLDSVRVKYLAPRARRFPSLGGGACFLSNRNTGGEINLRFGQGAFSIAELELLSATGAALPIIIQDASSGGTASVIGTGCRIIDKGEFIREGQAPLVEFRFEADRMILFHGLRLPYIVP